MSYLVQAQYLYNGKWKASQTKKADSYNKALDLGVDMVNDERINFNTGLPIFESPEKRVERRFIIAEVIFTSESI